MASDRAAQRVLALFDGHRLTPAQRRIAHCLVERATDAGYLSGGELAEIAEVSQPSVTRFATALGFAGYPELRLALRQAVAGDPGDGGAPERGLNELQAAVTQEIHNLGRLTERLADREQVGRAGALLAATRPLPVFGLRAAGPLAGYFGYFAAKIHSDVRVLDEGGTLLADRLDQARSAGATAILAFVLPRYPREAIDTLREAREAGLSVVTVTDSALSPAAAHSDVVLPAAVSSRLVFDLHTAPMALATILLQAMCEAMPADTQARLEQFENSATRRGIFVS